MGCTIWKPEVRHREVCMLEMGAGRATRRCCSEHVLARPTRLVWLLRGSGQACSRSSLGWILPKLLYPLGLVHDSL